MNTLCLVDLDFIMDREEKKTTKKKNQDGKIMTENRLGFQNSKKKE